MKKILRLFRRTEGFTLVEMVVSVALLAILLGGMMMFITPILRSFNDNMTDLTAENAATCIQEYITKRIRNANQVAIFTNTNATDLFANSTYASQVAKMNQFCNNVNKVGDDEKNKTYLLKCISIKFDSTDGLYYIYDENVNMGSNGTFDTSKPATKVFSDCLFNDLYMTFDYAKAKNGDYPAKTGSTEFREDALEYTINSYRDSARTSLAFSGNGVFELRQIKVMLESGNSADTYNLKIFPAVPSKFADMDEGSRDIFIYYVVRQLV